MLLQWDLQSSISQKHWIAFSVSHFVKTYENRSQNATFRQRMVQSQDNVQTHHKRDHYRLKLHVCTLCMHPDIAIYHPLTLRKFGGLLLGCIEADSSCLILIYMLSPFGALIFVGICKFCTLLQRSNLGYLARSWAGLIWAVFFLEIIIITIFSSFLEIFTIFSSFLPPILIKFLRTPRYFEIIILS